MSELADFGIEFQPYPGEPGKLISRWQQRVVTKDLDFMNTLWISQVEQRYEADMRADLAVFAELGESERASFIRERIRSCEPYKGRLLKPAQISSQDEGSREQLALF